MTDRARCPACGRPRWIGDRSLRDGECPSSGERDCLRAQLRAAEARAADAHQMYGLEQERREQAESAQYDAEARAIAAEGEVARLTAEVSTCRDLLAYVHRDGGHHTSAVGIARSVTDAVDRWANLVTRAEREERLTAKVAALRAARDAERFEVCERCRVVGPPLAGLPPCSFCGPASDPRCGEGVRRA